jgi:ABC-2 type transport system permease protein
MTATTVALSPEPRAPEPRAPEPATRPRRSTLSWSVNDVIVLTRRSLARIAREPESLMDVTIMPVVFVLLFAYVFGSAIHIPGGGDYHQYLIGGMLGMGMANTAPGTAVGIVTDMSTGLIDRFKSLPMSRAAVLAGRTIADVLTQVIGLIVVCGVGLAIGWRVHTGPADVAAALALALLMGYAFTWMGACVGMSLRSPEAAQATGFVFFLPLTFISNAFVPTQGMPAWLRAFANWNPLSALAAACRHLFGNPNPAAAVHVWPMQHPELTVLVWSAGIIAVFAPLSVRLYRRKSL